VGVLDIGTLAYVAGVVDLLGLIRLRVAGQGTQLPSIAISNSNVDMRRYLAQLTGTKAITARRS